MIYSVIALIIIIGLVFYWKYFYTYSIGSRTGLLQKFSCKGNIIKTYEGEITLSNVSGNALIAFTPEKFYFSVTDKNLAQQLEDLQGQTVVVHYKQKNGVLFWRGDSKYVVDSIKPIA